MMLIFVVSFCMFLWKVIILSALYLLQVEVDEPLYKYVYIVVRSTAMGAVDLTKVTHSHS